MSWICCFCGEAILPDAAAPLSLTVMQLNAETEAPAQALATHGACLAERLAPSVPFDADTPTPSPTRGSPFGPAGFSDQVGE